MRALINRWLKPSLFLPVFALAGLIYILMLSITIPKVMSYSGGMKIFDMLPSGYDPVYAGSLLNALGETGRHIYLFRQIPLDLIFPLLSGVSLCLITAYLLVRLGSYEGPLFYLSLLPLLAMIADYCENIGIIILLRSYPVISHSVVEVMNVFSIIKSSSTTLSFIFLIVLLISFWIGYLKRRSAR